MTPPMLAAGSNHADIVEVLLAAGADIRAVDGNGRNALHHAAIGGAADALRVLLEHENCPDVNAEDGYGNTALHYATGELDECNSASLA